MSKLVTAETFYNKDNIMGQLDNGTLIPASLWANWRFPAPEPIQPEGDADSPAVAAFVNEGRWMVKCPFGCGSAQVASETDHRFYCCGSGGCQNYSAGNKTIPVVWPDSATQTAVEQLLLVRPPVFRNWMPYETLEQLRLENTLKGEVA